MQTVEETGLGPFKTIRADGSFQSNILEGYSKGEDEEFDGHCTIKPLVLIKKLIEFFVPTGAPHTILDPFAGSGTTLVAAEELGHASIGIEIERHYVELARRRLSKAARRQNESLFADAG